MSVKSFEKDPRDMRARIEHPVRDQNNDIAALIIVRTTHTGFSFYAGSLGIVKTQKKVGEYWLYVPWGSKYLTIQHPKLGTIHKYPYPEKIDKATVYILNLVTASIKMIVEERLPQYVSIHSTPEEADVYIDGIRKGTTPLYNINLLEGQHTIKISKELYYDLESTLEVSAEEKFKANYTLKPNCGSLQITSLPEGGAESS